MLGYTYTTEQEAIDARQLCNNYYGFPKEGVAENWVGYRYSEFDDIYYILALEGVQEVLGEPIEFTITEISPV
jgi:hypothetical protein